MLPLALLGGENRRLVVFVKKMEQEEGEKLKDALRIVMGEQLVIVQSFAKMLLAKTRLWTTESCSLWLTRRKVNVVLPLGHCLPGSCSLQFIYGCQVRNIYVS